MGPDYLEQDARKLLVGSRRPFQDLVRLRPDFSLRRVCVANNWGADLTNTAGTTVGIRPKLHLTFALVMNLAMARALDLKVPAGLFVQATRIVFVPKPVGRALCSPIAHWRAILAGKSAGSVAGSGAAALARLGLHRQTLRPSNHRSETLDCAKRPILLATRPTPASASARPHRFRPNLPYPPTPWAARSARPTHVMSAPTT